MIPNSKASSGAVLAPGPQGLPIIGNYFDLRGDLLNILVGMHQQYGDLIQYRVGPYQFYNLNHPDYIRHVLVDERDNYVKDGRSSQQIRLLSGQSLLTDNGERWRKKRDLLQDTFRVNTVKQFKNIVVDEANNLIKQWGLLKGPIDIHAAMMHITYQVIGKSLMSTDLAHTTEQVAESMSISLKHLYQRIFGFAFPLKIRTPGNQRFIHERKKLYNLVDEILRKRRTKPGQHNDLLDEMIAVHRAKPAFNDAWLRDEVVTLLLAGHETTANALTWVWYLLSSHPEIEQQVYEEIMQHFPGSIDDVNKLSELRFTHMVFSEAIRLYPPIWSIERNAVNEDMIGGYQIKEKATVFISIYTLHRHPEFWQEPEKFKPERFETRRTSSDAYMPFGLGQRMCLGKNFAIQEAMIILIILMQQCRLTRADNKPVIPKPGITLRVRDKLMMNINWRN